jgi:hypothetical protein
MKLLFITLIWSFGSNTFVQDRTKAPGEKQAIEIITHLHEVIINNKYSLKRYKLPLVFDVDSRLKKGRSYYFVGVYYDRPDLKKLTNLYYFEVDAKTYTVEVLDAHRVNQ